SLSLSSTYLKGCSQVHSTFWLQMSFMWSSALSLKSAQLPVFRRMPFIAAWNAPTDHCSIRYNITISLKTFHVIGSPFAKARGQNVTIFYVNRLGYYPWYTSQEIPINGGLPQNFIIDWEHWRPQWERNWNNKNIYKRQSRKLISKLQENISANAIEHLAKFSFEKCAKAFMKETIELGIKSRPKGLWGYYLYPDCHNYNFHEQNYTGSCPENELMRNNELLWLWNSSAALYPSIGIKKSLGSSENTLRFSQFRVKESMRISFMTAHNYSLPVFVYTRLDYRDQPLLFLSMQDLVSTIGESAALGAAGIVIWGDMNLTSSESNCTKVKEFIASNQHLCRNNGRCIRRNWKALDYLHLNPQNFQIKASKNGVTVKGVASSTDLQTMAEKFTCHCYQGFEGADCRKIKTFGCEPGHSVTLISSRIVIMINLVSFIFLIVEISF
uniref:Hyaluronidase n=1 Tax=Naja naja TaxID=35670 RepID=A0A8C6VM84_NAJNA